MVTKPTQILVYPSLSILRSKSSSWKPEFDTFSETREVSSKDHLQITGTRLTDGLDITDYAVTIGTGTCEVIDLTANELICVIPMEKGQKKGDEHEVHVHPGTNLSKQLIGNSKTRPFQNTLSLFK